jgi:hypothetical protein
MNYLTIDYNESFKINFNEVNETGVDFCRRTNDKTLLMVSYSGSLPSFLNNITNYNGPYDYQTMFDILQVGKWKSPDNSWGL